MDVNFNLGITDMEDINCTTTEKGLVTWKLRGYDVERGWKPNVDNIKYLKVTVTMFGDGATKIIEAAQPDLSEGKGVLFRVTGQLEYDLATGEPRMWTGKDEGSKTHAACEVVANKLSRVFVPRGKGQK